MEVVGEVVDEVLPNPFFRGQGDISAPQNVENAGMVLRSLKTSLERRKIKRCHFYS